MLDQKKVKHLQRRIKSKRNLIARRKKSIPFMVGLFVLIYVVFFNLRETESINDFDNHLDYILTISSIFFLVLLIYAGFVFYQLANLRHDVKRLNGSLYKLTKLRKDN